MFELKQSLSFILIQNNVREDKNQGQTCHRCLKNGFYDTLCMRVPLLSQNHFAVTIHDIPIAKKPVHHHNVQEVKSGHILPMES